MFSRLLSNIFLNSQFNTIILALGDATEQQFALVLRSYPASVLFPRHLNRFYLYNDIQNNINKCVYIYIFFCYYSVLPANNIRPINSFLPMLSKSITITSREHSRIFSHGTLKLNDSLKTGFNVQVNIGVFLFSTRLSPNWSHTFT